MCNSLYCTFSASTSFSWLCWDNSVEEKLAAGPFYSLFFARFLEHTLISLSSAEQRLSMIFVCPIFSLTKRRPVSHQKWRQGRQLTVFDWWNAPQTFKATARSWPWGLWNHHRTDWSSGHISFPVGSLSCLSLASSCTEGMIRCQTNRPLLSIESYCNSISSGE